jgi:hypothetical protein
LFAGSGKDALLKVISQRLQGPTRGLVALNGVPMTKRLFQVKLFNLGMIIFNENQNGLFFGRKVVAL